MNICLFADGRNVHIQRIAPSLAARGHHVHLVTHKPVRLPDVSVEKFNVPPPSLANFHRWPRRYMRYLRSFLQRFDVVVLFFLQDWGFTPDVLEEGCFIASPRGSDVVHPPGEAHPPAELVAHRVTILRHANLVGVSCRSFAEVVAEFANLDSDQMDRLPLGVDLDEFCPDRFPTAKDESAIKIGFFKGFRPVYGAVDLVRAIPRILQRFPQARFELMGAGPQIDECRRLADELDVLSVIQWLPKKPRQEIAGWLATCDVTVMPSLCESFGVAALESMAMSVPVVAARVGGLRELVQDGYTGVHIPPKSPDALADAVMDLLLDSLKRRTMGINGREWVRQHYAWNMVLNQWEKTLERARERAVTLV